VSSINRIASTAQGGSQTNYGYDNNGEPTSITNGLSQSTSYTLDALRRITAIHNPDAASATLSYNALDAVTQAKDFKGVSTSYTRDAQGHATQEASADIGSQQSSFDADGNLTATEDALGQTTQITRDALGRPTQINASAGAVSLSSALSYEPASGQLSQMQQPQLTTGYQRDSLGRITRKSQSIGGSQP
jgi:YD repeat-containing protein